MSSLLTSLCPPILHLFLFIYTNLPYLQDLCRFVSTGRFETHEQTKHLGCSEHTQDKGKGKEKAIDADAEGSGTKAKLKGPDVDFPTHQWRVIGVGWPEFQEDLVRAAKLGVKVWRMKVCVVTLP
jgi:hypothetical protein